MRLMIYLKLMSCNGGTHVVFVVHVSWSL